MTSSAVVLVEIENLDRETIEKLYQEVHSFSRKYLTCRAVIFTGVASELFDDVMVPIQMSNSVFKVNLRAAKPAVETLKSRNATLATYTAIAERVLSAHLRPTPFPAGFP